MIYLVFSTAFVVSFLWMDVGILLLMINTCTITIPFLYYKIPGIGGLQMSDFALMGIAANLFAYKRLSLNHDKRIFIFTCLWFLCVAAIELGPGGKGINVFYNMFIRTGLLWLVPVAIISMPRKTTQRLFVFITLCALFVTVIQGYAFYGHDAAFVAGAYYQFQNPDVYLDPEQNMVDCYDMDILPRMYPSGTLLVLMVMIFYVGVLFADVKRSRWETFCIVAGLVAFSLFFLSLRQRSAILALCLPILFLMRSQARNIQNRRRLFTYALSFGVVILVSISLALKLTNLSFFQELIGRFQDTLVIGSNRLLDDGLAMRAIIQSPLNGIGRTSLIPEARASGLNTLGLDVHPFLAAGLLAGVPFMTLIIVLIRYLYRRYRIRQIAPHDWVVIAVASAILYALFLALLNITQLFTDPKHMVPFLIFAGLFLAYSNNLLKDGTHGA